jgi:CheY-like chemotaxis protein
MAEKVKILIIDDDPDIVEALTLTLEKHDYTVFSESEGGKGVDRAGKVKPDLIILDIMMEEQDSGFTIAREIKQNQKLSDTPILMLTAIREKTGFGFAKEAGDADWLPVDDYVEKPLNPATLIAKVKKLTGK